MKGLWDFREKLKKSGQFQTVYETTNRLALHFKRQQHKLFKEGYVAYSRRGFFVRKKYYNREN